MPTPKPDEDKDEFMSRCIPMLIDEGKEQDEAVAICSSLWEQGSKGMSEETIESMDYNDWRQKAKDGNAPTSGVLIRKNLPIEIKQVEGENGSRMAMFILSTGGVDRYNDAISAEGWETANFMRNPVVLWSHNQSSFGGQGTFPHGGLPIARGKDIRVEGDKLVGTAEFFKEEGDDISEAAKFINTIWEMVKGGFLNAVSVGFDPLEWTWDEKRSGYNFIRQELLEFSMVPIPANADALAIAKSAVKLKGADFDLKPMVEWSRAFLHEIDDDLVIKTGGTAVLKEEVVTDETGVIGQVEGQPLNAEELMEELLVERDASTKQAVLLREALKAVKNAETEIVMLKDITKAHIKETVEEDEKGEEAREVESLEMDTDGEVTVLTIEEDSPEDDAALAFAFDLEALRDVIAKPVDDLKRQFTKTTGIVV